MDAKTIAIIAHIPVIGWLIGWILNMKEKDEFAAFYNRQQTGIHILWFICAILPLIGWILGIGVLVLWVLSLIGAVEGEKKPTPFFGPYFQRWL
ncbi:MAG: hypothetical protein ACOC1D_00915 [Prolixibacteraceae bacterium]